MSESTPLTKESVVEVLGQVPDSTQGDQDVVSLEMIGDVTIQGEEVTVQVKFDDRSPSDRHTLEDLIADKVETLDGVTACYVDSEVPSPPRVSPATPPSPASGGAAPGGPGAPPTPPSSGPPQPQPLAGVKNIIAVASGKGGVGKSTVAVNLAYSLIHRGHSVGLLDCDLYGPSAPILLGLDAQPKVAQGQLQPLETQGLRVMSLGFLLDEDSPVIWRGPIVMGIVRQFLQDVNWAGTDFLIIDLPPGTGDTQLTLVQTVPLTGALIVTTPSDLSLADASRGLRMFTKVHVPVFGIVENMSYFDPPGGGDRLYIFGEGGGKRIADRLEVPFLGEIPIDTAVREGGDAGRPVVKEDPDSAHSAPFLSVADALVEACGAGDVANGEDASDRKRFLSGLFNR